MIGVARRESVVEYAMLEHCVRDVLNRTRRAAHGRAAAAQGRDHELSRGPGRGVRGGQQPGGPRRRARARCRSRASCGSSARTSWRTRRRSSSGSRPGREVRLRVGLLHHLPGGGEGRRGRGRRAALHLRSGDARRQRARRPLAQGDPALGLGAPTRSPARCASTTTSSRRPDPGAEGDLLADLNPQSEEVLTAAGSSRPSPALPAGTRVQFERLGYFCVDKDATAGRPVFNRTVTLRDTWAQVQARGK